MVWARVAAQLDKELVLFHTETPKSRVFVACYERIFQALWYTSRYFSFRCCEFIHSPYH